MARHPKKPVLALVALAAASALAACGSSGDETGMGSDRAEPQARSTQAGSPGEEREGAAVPTIVIRNGEPVGGVEELEYDAGEEIRFRVESDVADEVHLHGYDVMEEVPAGGSVSFEIPAEIEGIFEVELEDRGVQIAELQVNP